jgi:hypothetical protein
MSCTCSSKYCIQQTKFENFFRRVTLFITANNVIEVDFETRANYPSIKYGNSNICYFEKMLQKSSTVFTSKEKSRNNK